jgi:hypothetical protein
LKDNKKLLEEVKEKIPLYDMKREPIKLKFKYIQENEDTIHTNPLTEEDKIKKDALDEHFQRFKDGLEEAELAIRKFTQHHKQEVDSQIEEFKKTCIETRNNFKAQAPTSVDKEAERGSENSRAFEKLDEFKALTMDHRADEQNLRFGLDIFDIDP